VFPHVDEDSSSLGNKVTEDEEEKVSVGHKESPYLEDSLDLQAYACVNGMEHESVYEELVVVMEVVVEEVVDHGFFSEMVVVDDHGFVCDQILTEVVVDHEFVCDQILMEVVVDHEFVCD
jgi:hypothetical protein